MTDMATGSDRRSRDPEGVPLAEVCECVTGSSPRRGSLGRVMCTHAQPEVAQYAPQWGLFTESDVIKRHVTPNGFP